MVKQTLISSNYTYNTALGYFLSGGTLQCSNVVLRNPFHQSGGLHQISSTLSLSGTTADYPPQPVRYYLSGSGALYAPQIVISNQAEFSQTGGNLLNNSSIQLAGGSWLCNTVSTTLGELALGTFGAYSNSFINLATNTTLQFANSNGQAWDASGRLIIQNWQGAINGNGANRVKFGPGGLTPQQVALAQFDSPAGVGAGLYPARLLSSGELVPDRALFWRIAPGGLVLEWPAGATLQSSTNVNGPYIDQAGATSPYTNHFAQPRLFFRLRM